MSQGKNDTAAQVKQFIAGANKHFPNGSEQLQVGGATFTVTGLTALMQSFVDNRQAAEATRTALKAKVETERTQSPSQLAVVRAFETRVRGTFGWTEALADFGLVPLKARAPQTAEQKAVAAAKRAATRTARGTLGKNQKKSIKGSVTAKLVVTPATTSAASMPVAPPASPAPVGNAPVGNAPAGTSATAAAPVGTTPAPATTGAVTPHTA
jgi:hypothetical protein